jgi:hypothetical protein
MYPSSAVSKIMQDHYIMFYNCASCFKIETLYRQGIRPHCFTGRTKYKIAS